MTARVLALVGRHVEPWIDSTLLLLPLHTTQAGDQLTFSWTFRGVGNAACYHDGEVVENCTSPVKVASKPLAAAVKKTFTVVFTDVCGRTKNASYSYTQAGVTADDKVEQPATPGEGAPAPGVGGSPAPRNAAEPVAVAASLRTLLLSLLAAVAFAALL
jgi:hypothetical protein